MERGGGDGEGRGEGEEGVGGAREEPGGVSEVVFGFDEEEGEGGCR